MGAYYLKRQSNSLKVSVVLHSGVTIDAIVCRVIILSNLSPSSNQGAQLLFSQYALIGKAKRAEF
jgi:hypothetical protein